MIYWGESMKKVSLTIVILMTLFLCGCRSQVSDSQIRKDLQTTDCAMCYIEWMAAHSDPVQELEISDISTNKRLTEDGYDTIWATVTAANDLIEMNCPCILYYRKYTEGGWQLENYELQRDEVDLKLLRAFSQDELSAFLSYYGYINFGDTFKITETLYDEYLEEISYTFDMTASYTNCDISGPAKATITIESRPSSAYTSTDAETMSTAPICAGLLEFNFDDVVVDWEKSLGTWRLERDSNMQILLDFSAIDISPQDTISEMFQEVENTAYDMSGDGSTINASLEYLRWDKEYVDMQYSASGTFYGGQAFDEYNLEPYARFEIMTTDNRGDTMQFYIDLMANTITISQSQYESAHISESGNYWINDIFYEEMYR